MTALVLAWCLLGTASWALTIVAGLALVCHPDRRRYIYTRHLPNALDD